MFQPTRDQARQFLFDAWGSYGARQPLSGVETMALAVILLHPERHSLSDGAGYHPGNDADRY
jgi:hypothetical protein